NALPNRDVKGPVRTFGRRRCRTALRARAWPHFCAPLGEIEMKHVIRMALRMALAAAALMAAPIVAQGAHLARVPAVSKVPPPAAWTGCYVGLNVGGGWAPSMITDGTTFGNLGSPTPAGVVGGGQFGCDFQIGQFVIGIQAMASAADI